MKSGLRRSFVTLVSAVWLAGAASGQTWTNLGDGVNGYVHALLPDGYGNLYVGGCRS